MAVPFYFKIRFFFIISICQLITFLVILSLYVFVNGKFSYNLFKEHFESLILKEASHKNYINQTDFLPSLLYCDWNHIHCSKKNISKLYNLKGVAILTRHGERTPLHEKAPKLCHFESQNKLQNFLKDLKIYHYTNAHKFINRFLFQLKMKQCTTGQMTIRGIEQMRSVGYQLQKYRKLSVEAKKSIPQKSQKERKTKNVEAFLLSILNETSAKNLDDPNMTGNNHYTNQNSKKAGYYNHKILNSIFVQSTPFSRTTLSALALLHTFVSNINIWNRIPIHIISNIYHRNENISCSRHAHASSIIKKKLLYDEQKILAEAVYTVSFIKLNYKHAAKLKTSGDVIDFISNIICQATLNDIDCVNLTASFCLPIDSINVLWKSIEILERQKELDRNFFNNNLLLIFPLLKEITVRFASIANLKLDKDTLGYTPPISIYSGHDKTLVAMLHILGLNYYSWPGYASLLLLELHQYKKNHFIRVDYNNKDVTHLMTPCIHAINEHGFCPFSNFMYFVLRDLSIQFDNYCL